MNREHLQSRQVLRLVSRGAGRAGLWLVVAWACCVVCCRASPPSGDYRINFGDQAPLWDVSGSYHVILGRDPFERVALSFEMEADSRGRITGTGCLDLDKLDGGTRLRAGGEVRVVGRVFSARDKVRALLRFDLKGKGVSNGVDGRSSCRVVALLELDPAQGALAGRCAGSYAITVPGHGRRCLRILPQEFVAPLPSGTGGRWSLHLENVQLLGPNSSRLRGAASIELFNGRVLPLDIVRGVYWPRGDEWALVCAAGRTNTLSRGIRVSLRAGQGEALRLERAVIRCLGQTIRVVEPPES